jgi:hypothetical protein
MGRRFIRSVRADAVAIVAAPLSVLTGGATAMGYPFNQLARQQ